jgi:diguanylate cyclase (GGDEF)-like protein
LRDTLLLLSTPLVALIFAVTFLVIWQQDRARTENAALGAGWLMLATAMLISQFSPPHMGRALVAITHVPYTLAGLGIASGILLRVGATPPVRTFLGIGLAGICAMALTQTVGNSIKADLLITNLTSGIIMVITTQIFVVTAKRDGIERFMLVTLILVTAQFFLRPTLAFMFDTAIPPAEYRQSAYYLTLAWLFGFGSVLFGLVQLAASVKDYVNALKTRNATDELSGLLARGEFELRVKTALAKASSENREVALVVGDLDHFKQVNDIWGHQVGDRAIAGFGAMAGAMIRSSDIAGRVGGEEFCILVWKADENIAAGLAERLRARTSELDISEGALDVRLSASFGVAQWRGGEGYRALFARADKALYDAKQSGRNCVRRCGVDAPIVNSDEECQDVQRSAAESNIAA